MTNVLMCKCENENPEPFHCCLHFKFLSIHLLLRSLRFLAFLGDTAFTKNPIL